MSADRIPALRSHLVQCAPGEFYITPEGVADALDAGADPVSVAREVLAILGKQANVGAEDGGLCAYIAWRAMPQVAP